MQLSRATLYAMQESIHEQTPAEKINFLRKLRAEQLRLARSWVNVPAARDMHVQAARSVHADIRSMTAVELASSIDVDTTAEAREIAGDIATFGGQHMAANLEMGDFTIDAQDWHDQIAELRGGL